MKKINSFYWFDYETFGTDPAMDWPAQFAGIRTDTELNETSEPPLNIFCQLAIDHLPHPESCIITGLTPESVNKQGLKEPHFIKEINAKFMEIGTCATGYNSLRFDDEVTRNSLYRNFYDPYAREWQGGNSRWDLIDLVRLIAALRPEGINWPMKEDGSNSFKLEDITAANNLEHGDAHDALSDVRATIALAKLIKTRQPKVYHYALNNRGKQETEALLDLKNKKPVVHVSGMFGAERHCLSVVMPLAAHPTNSNGIIVYDLAVDPEPLLTLSAEEIQERLFTPTRELPNQVARIPLKVIHLNKCPIVAPLNVLRPEDCERLKINIALFEVHRQKMLKANLPSLGETLKHVFSAKFDNQVDDPELMLYRGGFFSQKDRETMKHIVESKPDQLHRLPLFFDDNRLEEMFFRYRARHYPEYLNIEEKQRWQTSCIDRLTRQQPRSFGFTDFIAELADSRDRYQTPSQRHMLDNLERFVKEIEQSLGLKQLQQNAYG